MPLDTILINHVNCKVIAIPSILRIIAFCADDATFDRCINSWDIWFDNMRGIKKTRRIFIYCKDKDEYELSLATFAMAKGILMMSEPEKMIDPDELPSEILAKVADYVKTKMAE